MKRALLVAATAFALAACSRPAAPQTEASPELAGISLNGSTRTIGRAPETVTAAGWSCEVRPGPYGVAARCAFGETDATVVAGVHCENAEALSLGGSGDARLELSVICTRPDGTCFDNRFARLGGSADGRVPRTGVTLG